MKLIEYIAYLQELHRRLQQEQGHGYVDVYKGIFEAPPPRIETKFDLNVEPRKVVQI